MADTPRPRETLGAYLLRCRTIDDVSRRSVARRSGVSLSRVSSIEDGTTDNPGIKTVAAIADVLEADPVILMTTCLPPPRAFARPVPVIYITDKICAEGALAGGCTPDEAQQIFTTMADAAGFIVQHRYVPPPAAPDEDEDDYDDTYADPDRT